MTTAPSMTVITTANLPRPDNVYASLIAAHDGLTEPESQALNARLILILANGVGLAMRWPVYSALIPGLVPRAQLPAALDRKSVV